MRSFALSCTHRPAPASPRGALDYLLIALASACALAVPAAHAVDDTASNWPVTAKSSRWRVEMEASTDKLVDADSVEPGDVIEYRDLYTSASKTAVSDLTANLPTPKAFINRPRSAKESPGLPAALAVARDGQSGPAPLMVTQGGKKVYPPHTQYRILRWRVVAMPAGRNVKVSARARVAASRLEVSTAPASADAAYQH